MHIWLSFGILFLSMNSNAVIIGSNDLVSISSKQSTSRIQKLARVVGHVKTSIIFPSRCSGFLVSESLFVTTTDCIPAFLTPGRIKVYFNNLEKKNEDKFRVDEIVMRDGPTKLVLLRLKKTPGKQQGFLKLSPNILADGDRLDYIENHSDTFLLQFMSEKCEVFGYTKDGYLAHDCDTTTTQGAPLINEKNEVVGMQFGFYLSSPILNSAISSYKIESLVRSYIN